MIDEIRGFNNSLEALFPDLASKTAALIRNDIDQSVEIRELQVLQEATANEHEQISETASIRIEALGATARTVTGEVAEVLGSQADSLEIEDEDQSELNIQIKGLESFLQIKNHGALTLSLLGPSKYSARVSAYVYWDGEHNEDRFWATKEMGYTKLSHPSFGT
jgi:hypothetical protein